MSPTTIKLKKIAILTHRWMGVAFCVLFAAWFISGIVMMYWEYPGVDARERLSRSEVLEVSRIQVSPEQAYARLPLMGPPDRVRITVLDGRPVYRFHHGPFQSLVYADSGQPVTTISPGTALRIASAWTGQPASAAKFEGFMTQEDQWTVSQAFRPLRPLLKYSWPNAEQVYVSQATGEVVQHTTPGSRIGAYFGAIPHWLYFTPLRKKTPVWRVVVIGLSGIGAVLTIFGLMVGVWLYSPVKKRYRFPKKGPSGVPYAGQKRWHTMLGLLFGLFAFTWTLSGMLSMNPFEWSPEGAGSHLAAALRGAEWQPGPFSAEHPRDALQKVASLLNVKELELAFFAGEPVYLATEAPQRSRIIPVQGAPQSEFERDRVVEVLATASRPHVLAEVRLVEQYEPYYLDRHYQNPLPVLFVRLNDSESSMHYVDLRSGRIVQSYVARSRWNRWLYHGLHSFDLPWLYQNRPAWDIAVLTPMLGGTALTITSVVIGWRRLRQKLAMRSAERAIRTQIQLRKKSRLARPEPRF